MVEEKETKKSTASKMIDLSADSILQPIKYQDYDGSIKVLEPTKALSFDSKNIPYETQATTYFNVSQLAEKARFNMDNQKIVVDKVKAEAYQKYSKVDPETKKKPTENAITASINSDADVMKAELTYNKLAMYYNVLLRLSRAFEQRKDLMQSLAASKRAEMAQGFNTAINEDVRIQEIQRQLIEDTNNMNGVQ